jgi:MFS family permease
MSKRLIAIVCMAMHTVALLLVAHVDAVASVVTFAILHGLAWGTRGPMMQAWRADYFGRSSFGAIMGFSSTIIMIGTVAAPWIAGVLYDRTGSYELGFTIIAGIAAAGSVFFMLSWRPKPPTQPGTPSVVAIDEAAGA